MPAILPPSLYDLWLDPAVKDTEPLQAALRPFPVKDMVAYSVGTR
jgi:hypothetical protein